MLQNHRILWVLIEMWYTLIKYCCVTTLGLIYPLQSLYRRIRIQSKRFILLTDIIMIQLNTVDKFCIKEPRWRWLFLLLWLIVSFSLWIFTFVLILLLLLTLIHYSLLSLNILQNEMSCRQHRNITWILLTLISLIVIKEPR